MNHVGDTWDRPADEPSAEQPEQPDSAPAEADRYVRRRILGQGGMGRVVDVEDTRLKRRVALKEALRPRDPRVAARLTREAAITARLEHPGIVPVYDAGTGADGRLFYTMRLIEGRSLSTIINLTAPDARLPLLRTFLAVCQAVAYAHEQGVIHRDLKPDNVMIGPRGEALVVDWGAACRLDEPQPPGVIGTPAYMSPEQHAGRPTSACSDIYSLGCTLYTILSSAAPIPGEPLTASTPGLANAPPEIADIVLRATARLPGDRYPSVDDLAADVARYLDGRLVSAHRYTPVEQLLRLLQRWRVPLLITAIAALLLAIIGARSWSATRAAQRLSDAHFQDALVAQSLAALFSGDRAQAETLAAHALQLGASAEARGVLAAFAPSPRPERLSASDDLSCLSSSMTPDGSMLVCTEAGGISVWKAQPLTWLWEHSGSITDAAFSGDGASLLIRSIDHTGALLSTADGTVQHRFTTLESWLSPGDSPDRFLHLTPLKARHIDIATGADTLLPEVCSEHILAATIDATSRTLLGCGESLMMLGAEGGEPIPIAGSRILADAEQYGSIHRLRVAPSGQLVALGSLSGFVEVLMLEPAPHSLGVLKAGDGAIGRMAFSQDEQSLAAILEEGPVALWDLPSGALSRLPSTAARDVAFVDRRVQILGDNLHGWRLPEQSRPAVFYPDSGLSSVAFSLDGTTLAGALGSGELIAWDLDNGRQRYRARVTSRSVLKDLAFSPDSQEVAAVGALLEGVSLSRGGQQIERLGEKGHRRVGIMQDGLIWALSWSRLNLWKHGAPVSLPPERPYFEGETSHNGAYTALISELGEVYRLSTDPAPRLDRIAQATQPSSVAITNDGETIAWSEKHRIVLASTDGTILREIPRDTYAIDLAISPNGRLMAASDLRNVIIYDLQEHTTLAVLQGHRARVSSVAFAADGTMLASGSWDESIRLWCMDALTEAPEEILAAVEEAWELSLSDAL